MQKSADHQTEITISATPQDPEFIWGNAILDKPLVGATIKAFDQTNHKFYEEKNATHTTGTFLLIIAKIPKNFLIIAENGTLNNKPFKGKIARRIHNYNKNKYYKLNGLTTLQETYRSKNPKITEAQAEKNLTTFLDISEKQTLSYAIDKCELEKSIFDHSKFMKRAKSEESFDNFIDKLTDEINAKKKHPFQTFHLKASSSEENTGLAAFIGKGIANGMVGWMGGQALGWVFHTLGYRTTTEHTLEETNKQLTNIQKSLDNVESLQIYTLNKIDALSSALTDVYKGLKWENEVRALQARSSTIVTSIEDSISRIKITFDCLQRYSTLNPTKVRPEVTILMNKTMDEILSPLNGIEPQLERLHSNIVGSLGEKGLLEVWSTLATLGSKSNNLNELYIALEQRFAYLLGMELVGITVMIDAYNGKHCDDAKIAKVFWENWKNKVTQQVNWFLRYSEQLVASRIDTLTGKEFNKLAYSPPVISDAKCLTSLLLLESDRFTQNLLNSINNSNASSEGLLTVRILNYPNSTKKLPQNLNLQLENTETKKAFYAAMAEQRNGVTVPDRNFSTTPFELSYYKFAVPFGTYRIKSMNNDYPDLLGSEDYNNQTTVNESSQFGSIAVVAFSQTLHFFSEIRKDSVMKSIGIDGNGSIYVLTVDWPGSLKSYIVKLDPKGNVINKFAGQLYVPSAITADRNGNVYILDEEPESPYICYYHIKKYDNRGNFTGKWGRIGREVGEFGHPVAMAIDNGGYVYVTDSRRCKVLKFESNGRFIVEWGAPGSGDGQFIEPNGIAVDAADNIYISDRSRIQKFDSSGRYLSRWGEFLHAGALAADPVGQYLYMFDLQSHRLFKFSLDGDLISTLSLGDSFLGFFYSDLAVDSKSGTLYVIVHKDFAGGQLQAWSPVVFVSRNW
jgi:sugar lactone lactonase YvrE